MNMRKIHPENLPAQVVLEKEKIEAIGEIQQSVRQIKEALSKLKELQDFTLPTSADPSAWNEALNNADKRKADALKAIDSDMALPTNTKQKLAQEWKEWHKAVAVNTNIIIRLVTKNPDCKFEWKNDTIEPTVPAMEVATVQAMRDVPSEAKDHALLIAIAHDAVKGLREWEREHQVKKIRLEQLLSLDSTQLAEKWANGDVFYPTYQSFDLAWERSNQSIRDYIENCYI